MKDILLKLMMDPAIQRALAQLALGWLRSQVPKTDNEIDDRVVEVVAKALGHEVIGPTTLSPKRGS